MDIYLPSWILSFKNNICNEMKYFDPIMRQDHALILLNIVYVDTMSKYNIFMNTYKNIEIFYELAKQYKCVEDQLKIANISPKKMFYPITSWEAVKKKREWEDQLNIFAMNGEGLDFIPEDEDKQEKMWQTWNLNNHKKELSQENQTIDVIGLKKQLEYIIEKGDQFIRDTSDKCVDDIEDFHASLIYWFQGAILNMPKANKEKKQYEKYIQTVTQYISIFDWNGNFDHYVHPIISAHVNYNVILLIKLYVISYMIWDD